MKLPPLAQIAKEAGDAIAAMQPDIAAANARMKEEKIEPSAGLVYGPIHYKEDVSPCTDADLKAHEIVSAGLIKYFPDTAILSEEGTEAEQAAALKANVRFETDPLDNTTGYIKGRDGYSVNIGLMKDGVPTEGVIYFPGRKEIYYTDGGKAFMQKGEAAPKEIKVKGIPLREKLKVAVGFNEQHVEHLEGREMEMDKIPGQLRTIKVATGEYDMSGRSEGVGGYNSWDIAGPHAVLRAAGGELIVDETRKPLTYGNDTVKVPCHFAGGLDTMAALGLIDKEIARSDKPKG